MRRIVTTREQIAQHRVLANPGFQRPPHNCMHVGPQGVTMVNHFAEAGPGDDPADPSTWTYSLDLYRTAAFGGMDTLSPPIGDPLGSHGSRRHRDSEGNDWLVKPEKDYWAHAEHATNKLQHLVGLEAPEMHMVNLMPNSSYGGGVATAQKMYPDDTAVFADPNLRRGDPGFREQKLPHLSTLDPGDVMTLQKHHVLDWLVGNHDSHVGQWIRNPQGHLVGIDKGNVFKYQDRDHLDPMFWPNRGREPVYNKMWRDHLSGRGRLNDPRTGELGQFIQNVQGIPDDTITGLFRPWAEGLAMAGRLNDPTQRDAGNHGSPRLRPATLKPNDPEAALKAVVRRKYHLDKDFANLYQRLTPGSGQ